MKVITATLEHHKELCRIARQTTYTRSFSSRIFSGPNCYELGRIRVCINKGVVLGLTCFRDRKRNPARMLYFIAVDATRQRTGAGKLLMANLCNDYTGQVELNVMKENPAYKFFQDCGFTVVGEAYDGKAWVMRSTK